MLQSAAFRAGWTAHGAATFNRLIVKLSPEVRMMLALGGGYLAIVVLFVWFFIASSVLSPTERLSEEPDLGASPTRAASFSTRGTKAIQHFAAFMMTFGPGGALGLYSVMAGFYQNMFNNNRFIFIWMLLSNYSIYPIVSSAQLWYDPHLDASFGTRVTYSLRVVALQAMLGLVGILWTVLPQTWAVIFGVGLVTGFFSASATNAALQLVGAMSEDSLIFCEMGTLVGAASPLVVIELLEFEVTSSTSRFRLVVIPHIVTCFMATAVLGSFHAKGVFARAYDRLSVGGLHARTESALSDASPVDSPHAKRKHSEASLAVREYSESSITEQQSTADGLKDYEAPCWVWWWCSCSGTMAFMSVCLLSLSGFFGSPSWAQRLAKLKLAAELVGGLLALNIRSWAVKRGPLHLTLVVTVFIRTVLLCISLAKLLGIHISNSTFISVVSVFHGFFTLFKPIVQSTIRVHIPRQHQPAVTRAGTRILFWGVLTGAVVGLITGWLIKLRERGG